VASDTREKIITAAMACFHGQGYAATGVQEIVDTAGLPKGSFYNHFKAKEALAVEVIDRYASGSGRERLSDASVAPLRRITEHFEFMAGRYERRGYEKGCLIGNLSAEVTDKTPKLRVALGKVLDAWTDELTGALFDGQTNGDVDKRLEASQAARFLINSWEGAIVRMKVAGTRQPLDDFFAIALPAVASGARP
jgi:TetR/AcrR family transcriptional repressor of nem operon